MYIQVITEKSNTANTKAVQLTLKQIDTLIAGEWFSRKQLTECIYGSTIDYSDTEFDRKLFRF